MLEIIKQEWEIIKENGDWAINPLWSSGGLLVDSDEELDKCQGYANEECSVDCLTITNGIIHIFEEQNAVKKKKHFCEPKHLLRYITEYYCRCGTKTWECFEAEKARRNKPTASKKRKIIASGNDTEQSTQIN